MSTHLTSQHRPKGGFNGRLF
ncbi:hypothetical protein AGR8A_Cc60345 [Agrobacterium fabrum str. J-07]|nr:hypothetical protein AGR8A_Cc60345 [Agrobacterium fabrum str. J-07]